MGCIVKEYKGLAFRYSKQVPYYALAFGGILVCAPILIVLFLTLLKSVGIDPDGIKMSPYWEEHLGLSLAIAILGAIMVVVISFLFPLKVALKLTDKKGVVVFDSNKVCFEFHSRNIFIPYSSIKKITFTTIHMFKPLKPGGPPFYRLKLKTNHGRYFIQCSFREAWQCRKEKTKPTIWALCNQLSLETGLTINHVLNRWG